MEKPGNKALLSRSERLAQRTAILQTVLAVSGFFVAIIALYAALNESDAVRKQQQAAVWPALVVTYSEGQSADDISFSVELANKGIGPARIKNAVVTLDEQPMRDWFDVLAALGVEAHAIENTSVGNGILSPDEKIRLFRLAAEHADRAAPQRVKTAFVTGKLRLQFCYCSVFDECWRIASDAGEAAPAASCPAPKMRSNF